MNKRFWFICSAVSATIMLILPWLAVTFVRSDAGMAFCLLLFYAINPLYVVIAGAVAGSHPRYRWPLPLLISACFLLGTWLCFDMGEALFLLYAAVYAALGYLSMLITQFIRKKPFH